MCSLSGRRLIHTCGSRSLLSTAPSGAYDKKCDPVEEKPSVFSGGFTFCTDDTGTLKMAVASVITLVPQLFLIYGERIILHRRQVLDSGNGRTL